MAEVTSKLKILVAGVGNLLKCDDGLGPQVIAKLGQVNLPSQVDVMDLGTSGMDVIHYSRNYDKVIFIDAIKFGKPAGTAYLVKPSEIEVSDDDMRNMIYMSMHEINLEKVIAIGRRLDDMPNDIVIIGCEPEDTTTTRIGLTEKVSSTVPQLIRLILEEIARS